MIIGARFAAWRARLGVAPRLVVIALFAAAVYGVARAAHGTAAAPSADAILLGLVVLCGAIVGFPFAAAAALLLAVMDYAARSGLHESAAVPSAIAVGAAGLLLSPLFTTAAVSEDASGASYDPGQLAFGSNGRVALPRGESFGAIQNGISMLASGVRDVSQGDFTKNLAVADGALSELAVAVNKLIFGMREFLHQLHDNARRLGTRAKTSAIPRTRRSPSSKVPPSHRASSMKAFANSPPSSKPPRARCRH